jgi:hypothetical protein
MLRIIFHIYKMELTHIDNEKINTIKKQLYDSNNLFHISILGNGQLSDKGRLILKEIGIRPDDLEER